MPIAIVTFILDEKQWNRGLVCGSVVSRLFLVCVSLSMPNVIHSHKNKRQKNIDRSVYLLNEII